jgi:hypothetical protein
VRFAGLYANDGATATLTDVFIHDVDVQALGEDQGEAIICSSGCVIDGMRVRIERASRIAIAAQSSITLNDLYVADTSSEHGLGEAIVLSKGTTLDLTRVLLWNHPVTALRIQEMGSKATIRDLTIPAPAAGATQGVGVSLDAGAELVLQRARIEHATGAAIRVTTAPFLAARAELEDLIIRDTQPNENTDDGYGIQVGFSRGNHDADAETFVKVTRGSFERNTTAGIGLSRVVPGELNHIRVTGTQRGAQTKEGGVGIAVTGGSRVTGDRIEVIANTEAGMMCGLLFDNSDFEAYATFTNFRSEKNRCHEDEAGCNFLHGAGIGTGQTGNIRLTRFLLQENISAGANLFTVGMLDLEDGLITHENIGVNIPIVGYDLGRLIRGVTYDKNGVDISTVPQ